MKRFPSKFILAAALPMLLVLSGCASHGKLSSPPRNQSDALLTGLLSQTDQYVVHYYGSSKKIVSGVLFDPQNDHRHIRPDGFMWKEINNAEDIAAAVDTIQRGNFPKYVPNLYEIIGPEGDFYGYLFSGWNGLVIKPIDEHTVKVYGLKGPPEYENVKPGGI